jgi:sterol desaturase/sphingolipid hydroxylase (fatty acid hydroxylase superfamily)
VNYSIKPSNEGVAVAVVIGVFLVLAAVEYGVARATRRSVHRFSDSVANLACGAAHQVANLYYATFVGYGYEFVRDHVALASVERFSLGNVVVLFLVIDLIYYWEHRLLHARRGFWASHVVHHQSGEFNLTVSLRVSILQVWMTMVSVIPIAIVGFPPGMALTVGLASKFYQLACTRA